jgi:hypothetical protein
VRATTAADAMPSDRFNTLVDHAVQDLVPAMDIQNFGDCGTVYIDTGHETGNKDEDARAITAQLMSEMGRLQRESCAGKPDPKAVTPTDHERQTIVYPANFWK